MFIELLPYLSAFLMIPLVTGGALLKRESELKRQLDIAARGSICYGRVVAVQRPFLFDSCTRLFFEFVPPGREQTLRCCHVARADMHTARPALPHTGASITVCYLPDTPHRAVIGALLADKAMDDRQSG